VLPQFVSGFASGFVEGRNEAQTKNVREEMKQKFEKMDVDLPKKISDSIRWDSIKLDDNNVVYSYTYTQFTKGELNETQKKQLRTGLNSLKQRSCSQDHIKNWIKNHNGRVTYVFHRTSQQVIKRTVVNSDDCEYEK
jgi:hypothetical protein